MKHIQQKEKYWQEMVLEQEKSDLSQKEFCEQKQIHTSTFTGWKSKLKTLSAPKAKFLSVRPVEEKGFSIFTPSGYELKFSTIPDPKWMREFLEMHK